MSKFRQVLLLSLAAVLCGCKSNSGIPKDARPFPVLHKQTELAAQSFPQPGIPLKPGQRYILDHAEELRDVLKLEHFIKLEVTDASIIAEVRNLLVFNGYLFVLDGRQNIVFQFTMSGQFVRRVGRQGSGPGEFEEPRSILHDQENLVVVDTQTNKLLFFNMEGVHIKSLDTQSQNLWLTSSVLLLDQTLYVFNYFDMNINAPYAAMVSLGDRSTSIEKGFGDRFEFMAKRSTKGKGVWRLDGYNVVDDMIWAGSPYSALIEVYDREGRHAGTLRPGFETLLHQDFDGVTRDETLRKLILRPKRLSIHSLGDLVFVTYNHLTKGYVHNVFDTHGNLLKKQLGMSDCFNMIHDSDQNFIYATFPVYIEHKSYYQKYLTGDEYEKLRASGWDEEDWTDDNVYISVGKLAEGERK